jgi:hypothetical protein
VTDENRKTSPWLPNLVGGTSIWKLARDLNETQFFDGRLLVPETEGTDALPTTVRWDVTGLLPLPEARTKHGAEAEAAIVDFLARLEKVAAEFKSEASGYHKFKEAFTVPGLDADGGAYYFYDERAKKLCVINWGASPRTIAGQQELIFGWGSFGKLVQTAGPLGAASLAAKSAAARSGKPAEPGVAAGTATPGEKKEEKKDEKKEEKKPVATGRPWWHWLLVVLAILALLALLLFLFKDCALPATVMYPEGGSNERAAPDAMTDTGGAHDGSPTVDGGDAAALADGRADGGGDGGPDGGDGGDGATDAPSDGPHDGAADARSDGGGDGGDKSGGGGKGQGAGGGGAGFGIGPGTLVGPAGSMALPHRFHFEPGAVKWRVSSGQNQLDPSSPVEGTGQNFEVTLRSDGSFDKVKVQWQDQNGRWHE